MNLADDFARFYYNTVLRREEILTKNFRKSYIKILSPTNTLSMFRKHFKFIESKLQLQILLNKK